MIFRTRLCEQCVIVFLLYFLCDSPLVLFNLSIHHLALQRLARGPVYVLQWWYDGEEYSYCAIGWPKPAIAHGALGGEVN